MATKRGYLKVFMAKTLYQKYIDQQLDLGRRKGDIAKEFAALLGTKNSVSKIASWYQGRKGVPRKLQNYLRRKHLKANHPRLSEQIITYLELENDR